jgi:hypothetical protein
MTYETVIQEAVDAANTRGWWSNHENLHFLCEYLNGPMNETEIILDVSSVLEILEKPWHFTEEFVKAVEQYVRDSEGDEAAFTHEITKMLP